MNPLQYLPALVAALASAACGLAFVLSFTAWILCEPCIRRGPYRPRPWLFLLCFAVLSALTYTLLP